MAFDALGRCGHVQDGVRKGFPKPKETFGTLAKGDAYVPSGYEKKGRLVLDLATRKVLPRGRRAYRPHDEAVAYLSPSGRGRFARSKSGEGPQHSRERPEPLTRRFAGDPPLWERFGTVVPQTTSEDNFLTQTCDGWCSVSGCRGRPVRGCCAFRRRDGPWWCRGERKGRCPGPCGLLLSSGAGMMCFVISVPPL